MAVKQMPVGSLSYAWAFKYHFTELLKRLSEPTGICLTAIYVLIADKTGVYPFKFAPTLEVCHKGYILVFKMLQIHEEVTDWTSIRKDC